MLGYLAQHPLFDQVPALRHDIDIPDYCMISLSDAPCDDGDIAINAWFGPGGTVSNLHQDPKHNLLCQVKGRGTETCWRNGSRACVSVVVMLLLVVQQVVGRKRIRLYAVEHSESMYPHDGLMSNTSQVDAENPDEGRFPKFVGAPFWMGELNPGDMCVWLYGGGGRWCQPCMSRDVSHRVLRVTAGCTFHLRCGTMSGHSPQVSLLASGGSDGRKLRWQVMAGQAVKARVNTETPGRAHHKQCEQANQDNQHTHDHDGQATPQCIRARICGVRDRHTRGCSCGQRCWLGDRVAVSHSRMPFGRGLNSLRCSGAGHFCMCRFRLATFSPPCRLVLMLLQLLLQCAHFASQL